MSSTAIYADLRPAYYDDFHCLATGCHCSCCVGWHISFDKKDYLSLKHQSGSENLNTRMSNALRRLRKGPLAETQYGEFVLEGGVCPLLREDHLCALQLEKGHGALPEVCRTFPRSESHQPSGYLERSLSPACEAVLDLLWNLPEGVEFRSDPLPKERQGVLPHGDATVLTVHFQEIRSHCLDILKDRRYPLPQRMLLLGLSLRELAGGEENINRWLGNTQALSKQAGQFFTDSDDKMLAMFLSNVFRVLCAHPNPNPQFAGIPNELVQGMGVRIKPGQSKAVLPTAPYLAARSRFQERFGDKEYFLENLMVSLFFHLHLPDLSSSEALWKSYVNFCNLYSFYRFMSVMSCREGASGDRDELFRLLVFASRTLIHNNAQQTALRDEFFQNDSATLAHMAILLSG